jgi:hypothetical protein
MSQPQSTGSPPPSAASPTVRQPSPAELFATLPPDKQNSLLEQLAADAGVSVDDVKARLAYTWEGWLARPSQLEPDGDWIYWLLKAGRGYGKTRIGAEWIRKQARVRERLHLIAPTAADARDVMVNGESGIMAITPRADRPTYFPSRRQLVWPNGAQALLFSGEDPDSLRGPQCEALWADEIAAWQYPQETWDMALLGLRLGDNPQACVTSTPKPIGVYRDLVNDTDCVVTGGATFENLGNLGPTYRTIIGRYDGTKLGRQELHAELLEDEGLAYRWSERLHVVPQFDIPDAWDRFEHMDYGLSAPTAWYPVASDFDGNLIVFDGLYEPGLPSEIAPKIDQLRATGWEAVRDSVRVANVCHADPAVFAAGARTKWGRPASVADEFAAANITVVAANNDRRAGFVRISELLKADTNRRFPSWHERHGEPGAPAMFIVDTPGTAELRQQLADAPLEEDGKPLPGEAVDRDWERSKGHAHASLRYGVLSRPSASEEPDRPPSTPDEVRQARLAEIRKRREKTTEREYADI